MIKEVILIDDDEITLMICEFVFAKNGFSQKTIKARNGEEGINLLKDLIKQKQENPVWEMPHVLFLDLNMPVMNGWDFLDDFEAHYQQQFPDMKIIILSSSIDPEDFKKSTDYQAIIDFISKPLTDEAVNKLKTHPELQVYFGKQ